MNDINVKILEDTLGIFSRGCYKRGREEIRLKLSPSEMKEVRVFLPDEIAKISDCGYQHEKNTAGCRVDCKNMDSFALARELCGEFRKSPGKNGGDILVLNLANPVNPGGGVRHGARAQEEELCRKSSLLLSLETEDAARYYNYNRSLNTYMGSDAIIITPNVEIIKDENGELLDDSVVVSVMTCAAPMIIYGIEGMTSSEYSEMVYNRILGMLKCAAFLGYKVLVLGAFGCGAFRNDAKKVSGFFENAIRDFEFGGMKYDDVFTAIEFAVLSRSADKYNFNCFYERFGSKNFFRDNVGDEIFKQKKEKEKYLDKIRGSLFCGAVGDALGYPVEFMDYYSITSEYGKNGITEYLHDRRSGKALISDDTQMSLFTANAILIGETRGRLRGIGGRPSAYAGYSYRDWLKTQFGSFKKQNGDSEKYSWLLDVPEMYNTRAPGNTCVSALEYPDDNRHGEDFFNNPINNSKGCGGIMRVAPLGIHYKNAEIEELDKEGALLSALTHGHSLGYMPSAVLTHILNRIVYPQKDMSLKEIIIEARDTVYRLFENDGHIEELVDIINLAVSLSENSSSDVENIKAIGEGWVAEETLAIALYCSLKYQNDFSKGVIAAVNHGGDSDSTGAVTGNILGAWLGFDAIEEKWKNNLELSDVILEMADDLCYGCLVNGYSLHEDKNWVRKYVKMQWKG